jgi:hypothetical protein
MKIGYVRLERGYMLCTLAGHLLARDGFVTRDPERQAIFSDEQAAIAEARRIARKRSARYIGEVR